METLCLGLLFCCPWWLLLSRTQEDHPVPSPGRASVVLCSGSQPVGYGSPGGGHGIMAMCLQIHLQFYNLLHSSLGYACHVERLHKHQGPWAGVGGGKHTKNSIIGWLSEHHALVTATNILLPQPWAGWSRGLWSEVVAAVVTGEEHFCHCLESHAHSRTHRCLHSPPSP